MKNLKFALVVSISLTVGCSVNQNETISKDITVLTLNTNESSLVPTSLHNGSKVTTLSATPTLEEYFLYSLKNSSKLKAAFLKYQAARQKAPQASALPDPKLSYGYFINSVETRVGPMRHRVGIAQPIPWFGKLSLREKKAESEARAAYFSFLSYKNQLISEVNKAYYEIAYLEDALNVTEANLELLQRWEQVLAQKYRSQTGTQANLIKVQVELGKLEDKLRELRDLKAPLLAEFNALLNRSHDTVVHIKTDPIPLTSTQELSDLSKELEKNNPELLFLNALTEAKNSGVELAHKDFYPDFSVGVDYTVIGDRELSGPEGGDDALATMFSLTLPLNRSKYTAALREAELEKSSLENMLKGKKYELDAKLSRAIFNVKDSIRRISLYRDTLVPKAEESLESTYTAFEAGEATFIDLLDTERVFLEFKLLLARAYSEFAIAQVNQKALLGGFSALGENRGDLK